MGKPSLLPLLLLLLFFSSISSSIAEIKTLKINADTRSIILFEKFGFTHRGFVTITVSDVSFASPLPDPDTALFGFFLLSDERLIQATYESQQQPQNPNPNSNPSCILSSPYVRLLFKFKDFDANSNFYNGSYPITHPDEYSLFFANCNPESRVSMFVHTVIYNTLPDGKPDYLSVGQSPVPSLYFFFALAYVAFLAVWIYFCLVKNRLSSHRIHHLMAGLLLTKALNLLFAIEDQHYVHVTGTTHGWDVLFFLFQFLKGVLLFTVTILIGAGYRSSAASTTSATTSASRESQIRSPMPCSDVAAGLSSFPATPSQCCHYCHLPAAPPHPEKPPCYQRLPVSPPSLSHDTMIHRPHHAAISPSSSS